VVISILSALFGGNQSSNERSHKVLQVCRPLGRPLETHQNPIDYRRQKIISQPTLLSINHLVSKQQEVFTIIPAYMFPALVLYFKS